MRLRIEFKGMVYERDAADAVGEAFGFGLERALDDEIWSDVLGFSPEENEGAQRIGFEMWELLVGSKLPEDNP